MSGVAIVMISALSSLRALRSPSPNCCLIRNPLADRSVVTEVAERNRNVLSLTFGSSHLELVYVCVK